MDFITFTIVLVLTFSAANLIADFIVVKFLVKHVVEEEGAAVRVVEFEEVKVKPSFRERLFRIKFFDTLAKDLASDLHDGYVSLAIPKDTYSMASEAVFYSTILGAATTVISVFLAILFNNIFILFFSVTGFLAIFYPYVDVFLTRREKDAGVSSELVFFATLAYIFQESGTHLGRLVDETVSELKGMFMWMWRECSAIYRERIAFAKDLASCLVERYEKTKSLLYRRFLSGYAYIYAEGGDLVTFLENQIDLLMEDFRNRVRKYIDSVGTYAEVTLVITIVLPTMLIAFSMVAPNMSFIFVFAGIALTVLAVLLMFFATRSEQPKFGTGDRLSKISVIEIVAPIAAGAVATAVLAKVWAGLAVAFTVFAVLYGRRGSAEMRAVREMEESLPIFLRDVASMRIAGKTVAQSIKSVYEEKRYSPSFRKVVGEALAELERAGRTVVSTGIWMVDYVFRALTYIYELGGGRPALLNSLATFIENMQLEKARVRNETRVAFYLSILSPIFYTIVLSIVFALATILSKVPSAQGVPGVPAVSLPSFLITAEVKEAIYVMVVVSTALSTMLSIYMRNYNLKEVLPLAFVMVETVACILSTDMLSGIVLKMLGVPA
jgi:ABC-type multidrug transport system fused ATPase/permease subunit